MSIHLFLPVEIPTGSGWIPTENMIVLAGRNTYFHFTTYATIHRLLGWVLVPLGVAALTGFLHRRLKY